MAKMTKKLQETIAAHFLDDPKEFIFLLEDIVRQQSSSEIEFEGTWRKVLSALNRTVEAMEPLYRR